MEKELQAYIRCFFNEMENKKIKKFKCNFQKFLEMESTIYLSIKVAELYTLSDGKGITGIHSAVF